MAKTAAEYQALLDKVDAAIEQVLEHGQSMDNEGMTHSQADLDSLMRAQKYYQGQIDKLSKGTRRVAELL
jgi:hypothetical protein